MATRHSSQSVLQCGEGGLDALSALRAQNCTCGCMGLPGAGLGERGRAERCEWQRDCGGSERRCQGECGSPECRQACSRQALKCRCECGLEVQDWRTVTDCKAREQVSAAEGGATAGSSECRRG